ncbi:hypothetical protein ACWDDN_36125 [Streptomyces griseoruber]
MAVGKITVKIRPAVRFAYGLIDTAAPAVGQLVGVLTLGIPTQAAVLTSVFGRLTPSANRA